MIRLVHLVVLALILAGCPRGPVTPTPDASDAAVLLEAGPVTVSPPSVGSPACQSACATLGRWCAEGRDPYCAGDLTKVEGDRLTVISTCPTVGTCFLTCSWCGTATSAAEAKARCGTSCSP